MASRPSWKGFVRFSLVSIPVKGYTAARSDAGAKVSLNQLHKGCGARVKYQKACPIHGELKADEIVSGYEFADDQYAVIDRRASCSPCSS
jgi:DNA end-binding protein Ku